MSDPVVSVCVVTYQHCNYIRQCLDSILAQKTSFDFEVLVGDDGSTDGTYEICREYAALYPDKVKVFSRSRKDVIYVNGHATGRANFIATIKAARGRYIALCEGDDYWCNDEKMEMQHRILSDEPSVVMTYHRQRITRPDKSGVFHEGPWEHEKDGYYNKVNTGVADMFTFQLKPQTRTLMFRNLFAEVPIPMWFYGVQFGDLALCFILGKFGSFRFIDQEMAVYRVTGIGMSSIFNTRKGQLTGDKGWMKVWSHAIEYHDYKYIPEALQGMRFFISRIRKATGNSFMVRLHLIRYVLFTLKVKQAMKNSLIRSLLNSNFEEVH
jgi:glycosyltransferase involved in cell wall biosynthesis